MTATIEKVPTQFITNSEGERIAVILPIAVYEQIEPMLQQAFDTAWDDEGEIRPEVIDSLLRQREERLAGKQGSWSPA